MAKMKISNEQFEELKKMVSKGITPEEISKRFGIAVSSVHNYKRQLKQSGLKVPDVRGKRPSDISYTSAVQPMTAPVANVKQAGDTIAVTINETVFYISSLAKTVNIGNNSITVTF